MYSLLCRHMNIGIVSSKHANPSFNLSRPILPGGVEKKSRLGIFIEKSIIAKRVLLFIAMLGMCMLIGDGILTPAISGLSPVPFPCRTSWFEHIFYIDSDALHFITSVVSYGWTKSSISFYQ